MPRGGGASGEVAARESVSLIGLALGERGSTVPPVMMEGHPGRGVAPVGLDAPASTSCALDRLIVRSDRNVLSLLVAYPE